MKYFPLVLLFLLLSVACQPSLQVVASQTAIANTAIALNWTKTPPATLTPTATNIPTNTSTPVPPKITILDAFTYDTVSTSASSNAVLQPNEKYWVVLSGTFSHWAPQGWTGYRLCWGTSEPEPLFPSPNKLNGPIGSDPYHVFAEPGGSNIPKGRCELREAALTSKSARSAIQLSIDGGTSFNPLTPTPEEIRADHTYLYAIIGQGQPLIIKIADDPHNDNYGQIFIIIEQIN